MKGVRSFKESVGHEVVSDRLFRMGPTINGLSWNVRGLNCPNKRGHVKWVLRKFSCDVAILHEFRMEVVTRPIAISLCWHPLEWLYLLSIGHLGGIIIIWDPQLLELVDSCIGLFSVCCKFKSQEDSF